MSDTIRETCLKKIKALFTSLNPVTEAAKPLAEDRYTVFWEVVTRSKLSQADRQKQHAMGIYDTEEQQEKKMGLIYCNLRIVIEFYAFVSTTVDQSERMNLILGEVQRRLREDIQLSGSAINLEETGNEIDIDGPQDRQCSGAVFLNLKYRYSQSDPRKAI